MSHVQEVTDDDFEQEVLQAEKPVLVDFWAGWCAPCRALAPTIDDVATDFDGRAKVVKLNVDDNQETPMKYSVRSIPTLLLFKGGSVQGQIVGASPKDKISRMIEDHL